MKKKVIIIAFLVAFAVPYGAKLLANKDKMKQLEYRLQELNKQIKQLEQDIDKVENQCEQAQTEAICEWSNQYVSARGIELARLKDDREELKEEIESHKKALNSNEKGSTTKRRRR